MGSACKDKLAEVTIISCIFLLVSKICGAYLNYDLLCYSDHIKKRNRRWYKAILLYFFPCFYLYYTLPSCYHIKGWSRKLAAMLAFIVTLNTFSFAPLEVQAANVSIQTVSHNKIETGCDVCDCSNEQIIYRFVVCEDVFNGTSYDTYCESYYGVTCSDCEIIHLIKSDKTFDFKWHGDGSTVSNQQEIFCGFVDTTKTTCSTGDIYNPCMLPYDIEFNCFVIQKMDGRILTYTEGIYSDEIHEIWNDFETNVLPSPCIPSMNLYYRSNNYSGIVIQTGNNAVKVLPKNSNPHISSVNVNNTNNNGLDIEIIDNGNNEAYTNGKGNTSDELTVSVADAINVKQTIKDSLVKAGIAATVVVGVSAIVAVAPGLATFFTIAGLTLGTAYICNVVGTMYDLFTRDYSSPDECRLAWGEFTSHMISDGAGLFVGSLVNKYLSPIIESKINEVKVNSLKNTNNDKYTLTDKLIDHVENPKLTKYQISGGHKEDSFIQFCNQNNITILNKTKLINPNIKGIYKYQYEIVSSTGKVKVYSKTVFNPNEISEFEYFSRGLQAINNGIINLDDNSWTGVDNYGVKWTGYVHQDIDTMYPDF